MSEERFEGRGASWAMSGRPTGAEVPRSDVPPSAAGGSSRRRTATATSTRAGPGGVTVSEGGNYENDYRAGRDPSWQASTRATERKKNALAAGNGAASGAEPVSRPTEAGVGFFGRLANTVFGRQTVPDMNATANRTTQPAMKNLSTAPGRKHSLDSQASTSSESSELDEIFDDPSYQWHPPDAVEVIEFATLFFNVFVGVFALLEPRILYKLMPKNGLYDADTMTNYVFGMPFRFFIRWPLQLLRFFLFPVLSVLAAVGARMLPFGGSNAAFGFGGDRGADLLIEENVLCSVKDYNPFTDVMTCKNGSEQYATAVGEWVGEALVGRGHNGDLLQAAGNLFYAKFVPANLQFVNVRNFVHLVNPKGPDFANTNTAEEISFLRNLQAFAAVHLVLAGFRYYALYQKAAFKKTSLLKTMRIGSFLSGVLAMVVGCVLTKDLSPHIAFALVVFPEVLVSAVSLLFIWAEQNRVAGLLLTEVQRAYKDVAALTPDLVRKFPQFLEGRTFFGAELPPMGGASVFRLSDDVRQSVAYIKDTSSVNISEAFGAVFLEVPQMDTMVFAELFKITYGLACAAEDYWLLFFQSTGLFGLLFFSIAVMTLLQYASHLPGFVSARELGQSMASWGGPEAAAAQGSTASTSGQQAILPLVFALQAVFVLLWSLAGVRAARETEETLGEEDETEMPAMLQVKGAGANSMNPTFGSSQKPFALQRGESDMRLTRQDSASVQRGNFSERGNYSVSAASARKGSKNSGLRHVLKNGYNHERDEEGYLYRDQENKAPENVPAHAVGRDLLRSMLGTPSASRDSAAEANERREASSKYSGRFSDEDGAVGELDQIEVTGKVEPRPRAADGGAMTVRLTNTSQGLSHASVRSEGTWSRGPPALDPNKSAELNSSIIWGSGVVFRGGSRDMTFGRASSQATIARNTKAPLSPHETDYSLKPIDADMLWEQGVEYLRTTVLASVRGQGAHAYAEGVNEKRKMDTQARSDDGIPLTKDYMRMRDYLVEAFRSAENSLYDEHGRPSIGTEADDGADGINEEEFARKIATELRRQEMEDVVAATGGADFLEEERAPGYAGKKWERDGKSGRWSVNTTGAVRGTNASTAAVSRISTTAGGATPKAPPTSLRLFSTNAANGRSVRGSSRMFLTYVNDVKDYDEIEAAVRDFRLSQKLHGAYRGFDTVLSQCLSRGTFRSTTTQRLPTEITLPRSFPLAQVVLGPFLKLCVEAVNVFYYPIHLLCACSAESQFALSAHVSLLGLFVLWGARGIGYAPEAATSTFSCFFTAVALSFLYTQLFKKATGVQVLDLNGFVGQVLRVCDRKARVADAAVQAFYALVLVPALSAAQLLRFPRKFVLDSLTAPYEFDAVQRAARWMQRFGDTLTPWWIVIWTVFMELEHNQLATDQEKQRQSKFTRQEFLAVSAGAAWQDVFAGVLFFLVGRLWEFADPQTVLRNYLCVFGAYVLPLWALLGSLAHKMLIVYQVGHRLALPQWTAGDAYSGAGPLYPKLPEFPETYAFTVFAYVAIVGGTFLVNLALLVLSFSLLQRTTATLRARAYLNSGLWLMNLSVLTHVFAFLLPALLRPALFFAFPLQNRWSGSSLPARASHFLQRVEMVCGFALVFLGLRRMQSREATAERVLARVFPTTSPITFVGTVYVAMRVMVHMDLFNFDDFLMWAEGRERLMNAYQGHYLIEKKFGFTELVI